MSEEFKLILSDRSEIDHLRLNGNNFISDTELTEDMFAGKLAPVTICHGLEQEEHEHMELVQLVKMKDKYWFVLRDITEKELAEIQTRADIDYLAMMTGVDL